MAIDDGTSVTTKLLTLLNVSATRVGKRKIETEDFVPAEKLNKRRSISFSENVAVRLLHPEETNPEVVETEKDASKSEEETMEVDEDVEVEAASDPYETHFGPNTKVLSTPSREAVDKSAWATAKETLGRLGPATVYTPDYPEAQSSKTLAPIDVLDRVKETFKTQQSRCTSSQVEAQNDLLSVLCSRKDVYIPSASLDSRRSTRQVIALHALNHISKKRRRVLKNNERLAKNPDSPPEDVQDQGFTRPSVLILLPFRNSTLDWFRALTSHTPTSAGYQVENQARFLAEYDLPPGAVDKLTAAEHGTYPADHVETFKGNVDDNFRIGVKMTRKTLRMFTEFYGCDLILASPLGLRRSIEKEKNADYLSSVEMLIVDQMDALMMQNWEHVKFVMSHMNKLPKESHDTDISRIKPWYLDGLAPYLRQSILMSSVEAPEMRALFNNSLKNVAGKVKVDKRWSPIDIPDGVKPNFVHFDCNSPQDEAEKRFHHFTTQTLPSILKSAVQSTNTVIFVPSSFDFIRVHAHLRNQPGLSFTVLSEYSTNQDISRARLAFFKGEKNFLLVSERFHFYKRYKLRGIRNLVFYGPPEHPQYFQEFLSYPFLDEGVDPSDVTCRVLYSRYDWFRLERIAGTEAAPELTKIS
ncbi:digestive organ expansion factor [Coprinellus micaceus]|uniref:U3 small nucleolar RNA-associated protein 25 n=1 Tax=Coprinellus micaceus TaxID=71717 RepID=A0A4Y7T4A2_COPMI|nr:digestive organ expansion factor [Coprinellus micaceus]